MTSLRLALLQQPIARPGSLADWAATTRERIGEAARAGAELLVLPEYGPVEIAAARPGGDVPDLRAELDAACAAAPAQLAILRELARSHGVWLLAGSLPMRSDARTRNRAPLIDPRGRVAFQDKRVMTRFEAEHWGVQPGDPPAVFETPWGRLGIAICYDVEFPALVRAQVEAGAWLVLCPTCTDTLAGFNRVRLSARARALENQCYVAVAPTVGPAPWLGALDANRGYAAVFGPVDQGFPEDGVLARGELDQPGWVHATLERDRLDVVRASGGVLNHRDWPAPPPPCHVAVMA